MQPCHFGTLAHLETEVSSKVCQTYSGILKSLSNTISIFRALAQSEQYRGIQRYWGIFNHTPRHASNQGASGKGIEASPALFWKWKKVPWFSSSWLCSSLGQVFHSKYNVLTVSGEKNVYLGVSFSCVFDKMFIKMPKFRETSPALKSFFLHNCTQTLFFLLHRKCLAVLWMRLWFGNC